MVAVVNTAVRQALTLGLGAARLPLSTYEVVARRGQSPEQWAPALAFEHIEANVKDVVGRLTGDQTLRGLAELQRTEIAVREKAIATAAQADLRAQDARRAAQADQRRIREAREQAAQKAEAREEAAEQDRRRKEREVAERAAKRQSASSKATQAREEALDEKATKAEARRLREEAQALQAKERSVRAESKVLALDRAVRAKKSARRAG